MPVGELKVSIVAEVSEAEAAIDRLTLKMKALQQAAIDARRALDDLSGRSFPLVGLTGTGGSGGRAG